MLPGRWHRSHDRWKMGAMSLEKVGASERDDCADAGPPL
jgi:hypothetical protein